MASNAFVKDCTQLKQNDQRKRSSLAPGRARVRARRRRRERRGGRDGTSSASLRLRLAPQLGACPSSAATGWGAPRVLEQGWFSLPYPRSSCQLPDMPTIRPEGRPNYIELCPSGRRSDRRSTARAPSDSRPSPFTASPGPAYLCRPPTSSCRANPACVNDFERLRQDQRRQFPVDHAATEDFDQSPEYDPSYARVADYPQPGLVVGPKAFSVIDRDELTNQVRSPFV